MISENYKVNDIDNVFLKVYINDFIKKFRTYNNEKFFIKIVGLKAFINKDGIFLDYLLKKLNENNFKIDFVGDDNSLEHIDITYENLTKSTLHNFKYQIQNLPDIIELSSKTDIPLVGILIMRIVSKIVVKMKTLYKAIVLDLDDTLWKGTVAEVGVDKIIENMHSEQALQFIKFMKFIKILASELGIFIAICSKNDIEIVKKTIEKLDENTFPLKNQIDLIIANYNDKSKNIIEITKQLSILPKSVVFIDDNQLVRDEVKKELPDVFVPEWENHDELITQIIVGNIFERNELSKNSQNRRKQYKILQTVRIQSSLPSLYVKINSDDKHIEASKLYSKSNQFKFSQNDNDFGEEAKSLYFEIYRENGENLGLCSAITYTSSKNSIVVQNWAMSCRYFGIGLEEFILIYLQELSKGNNLFIKYIQTEYNLKVGELLEKYPELFNYNNDINALELNFNKDIFEVIASNTNLKMIYE